MGTSLTSRKTTFEIIHPDDQTTVLLSQGSLDELVSETISQHLGECLSRPGSHIIVDLRNVGFLSSSILGILIAYFQKAKALNKEFSLANPQPLIQKIFRLTRVDQNIKVIELP